MPRKPSTIAPDWWDYTTLDDEIIHDAAALTPQKMVKLSRPGFKVVMYETLEEFYLAEALEYITAWKESTADNPVGICGQYFVPVRCLFKSLISPNPMADQPKRTAVRCKALPKGA